MYQAAQSLYVLYVHRCMLPIGQKCQNKILKVGCMLLTLKTFHMRPFSVKVARLLGVFTHYLYRKLTVNSCNLCYCKQC